MCTFICIACFCALSGVLWERAQPKDNWIGCRDRLSVLDDLLGILRSALHGLVAQRDWRERNMSAVDSIVYDTPSSMDLLSPIVAICLFASNSCYVAVL
jgi:hypothetical protein